MTQRPIPVLCVLALLPSVALADDVTVFAGSSLRGALEALAPGFREATGHRLALTSGGSAALARQISHGAPADVFISANERWMDGLEAAGHIDSATRFDLLGNQLVMVSFAAHEPVTLGPDTDMASLLDGGPLAMARVGLEPSGTYGKAALTSVGLWDQLASEVIETPDVRDALALVASGGAPLGIVYATDALSEPAVHVIATFDGDSHTPIRYPVAAIDGKADKATRSFLDYLRGQAAAAVFVAQGFVLLER